MTDLTTCSKITNFIEKALLNEVETWVSQLVSGDILGYESGLFAQLRSVYNYMSDLLLGLASSRVYDGLVRSGSASGCRKMEARDLSVKIGTGHQVKVKSPYAKVVPDGWSGTRHLLAGHWHLIGGSTPSLYDKVGYCSALSPSYDVAHQTLSKFGVEMCLSSVRDLTNDVGSHCFEYGEEDLMLKPGETMAGKRVVIATDGGRTRTRLYDDTLNSAGNPTYQTPWREPKLFVIDVLDNEGRPDRHEVPIYGCRFAEDDMLGLLGRYLKKLEIDQAAHIQIVADGAPWIWNNLRPLLEELNVDPSRITETLDYYHASGYIHDLVEKMPKRIRKKEREEHLKQFKACLWEGKTNQIVEACQAIFKRPSQLVKRYINYLDKHQTRTQYADYEKNNLMCGSGIIESGVRRVINLRFKNAATFWKKEIVEKLYFLRAALLSKRWDNVIQRLANSI